VQKPKRKNFAVGIKQQVKIGKEKIEISKDDFEESISYLISKADVIFIQI